MLQSILVLMLKLAQIKKKILESDTIILPGVGSFPKAVERLKKLDLINSIKKSADSGKTIFGICLGMQLLFESSEEYGYCGGLGLIKGKIKSFKNKKPNIVVPHVGWNAVEIKDKSIRGLSKFNNKNFYFVHSYYPDDIDKKNILMYTKYFGFKFPSVVKKQNIIACQFHPEKSGKFGLKFLKTFLQ